MTKSTRDCQNFVSYKLTVQQLHFQCQRIDQEHIGVFSFVSTYAISEVLAVFIVRGIGMNGTHAVCVFKNSVVKQPVSYYSISTIEKRNAHPCT